MSDLTPTQKMLRAVAGDRRYWDEGAAFALETVRRFMEHKGDISWYQIAHLPAPGQWKRFARLERDAALCAALALMPGTSERARLMALEQAQRRFRAAVWPAWRDLPAPPEGASAVHAAIWYVIRASESGGFGDLGWRQIGRVTRNAVEMTHNAAENETELTGDIY